MKIVFIFIIKNQFKTTSQNTCQTAVVFPVERVWFPNTFVPNRWGGGGISSNGTESDWLFESLNLCRTTLHLLPEASQTRVAFPHCPYAPRDIASSTRQSASISSESEGELCNLIECKNCFCQLTQVAAISEDCENTAMFPERQTMALPPPIKLPPPNADIGLFGSRGRWPPSISRVSLLLCFIPAQSCATPHYPPSSATEVIVLYGGVGGRDCTLEKPLFLN